MINDLLKGLGLDEVEKKATDYVAFSALETNVYMFKVKHMYIKPGYEPGKSAMGISLELGYDGDKTFRTTLYVSTKEGKGFYMTKAKGDKPAQKAALPGAIVIDDMCLFLTSKPFTHQTTEVKTVNIFDYESRKDVPTQVHVFTELIGKEVPMAVWKILENKQALQNGKYEDTAEERTVNEIDKVFHPLTGHTMEETREKKDAKWGTDWKEKNAGTTKDKRSYKGGSGGAPKGSTETGGGTQRKLFT